MAPEHLALWQDALAVLSHMATDMDHLVTDLTARLATETAILTALGQALDPTRRSN